MEYPIVMRPGEENVSSFKYNLIHLQSIKLMCGGRSWKYVDSHYRTGYRDIFKSFRVIWNPRQSLFFICRNNDHLFRCGFEQNFHSKKWHFFKKNWLLLLFFIRKTFFWTRLFIVCLTFKKVIKHMWFTLKNAKIVKSVISFT